MKTAIAIVLLLLAPAVAHLGQEHTVGMPMFQYKKDCGQKSDLKIIRAKKAALIQENNVPGAGITPFEPFETVLKDGFMEVDCIKDYMYYRGDKFGDNKHDYKLAATSNVSVVHYEDYVAKEDRKEMTQKVCFEFCRTVPNMGFFGIVNGRGCYCTPFFKQMASDSSQCDAVCEGENTLMCGGTSKSSIFSMHMCASTKKDMREIHSDCLMLKMSMEEKIEKADFLAEELQGLGEEVQATLGHVGDSAAADLAQGMKVFAGKILKQVKATQAVADKLGKLVEDGTEWSGSEWTDPAVVTKAERNMEDSELTNAEGEAEEDKLDKLIKLASEEASVNASKQYYPVMYFVDKEYVKVPQTCGGDVVDEPMAGTEDECATACDAAIHSCVAYQFFASASGELEASSCTLFSKLDSVFYYTGCSSSSNEGFLQQQRGATATKGPSLKAKCVAKLSKFEGTTLKVDKSGKTDWGLKKLTKADRCY